MEKGEFGVFGKKINVNTFVPQIWWAYLVEKTILYTIHYRCQIGEAGNMAINEK